ncbi:MAG TPA: hypothetical protein VIY48_16235 [Candidatus Paceibacterota bacterium]
MTYPWNAKRNALKKSMASLASVLKSKGSNKAVNQAATAEALRIDSLHRSLEISFNKIAKRYGKRAYLARFKSPTHTLAGKYTPTAIALLDFLLEQDIIVDRWILAQAELLRLPHFNLYHCYGESALKRYTDWESKQVKKFPRKENRDKQTDSAQEIIRLNIMDGHASALSWIPQLKQINPPSLSTALFYLLPYLQGWYVLSYDTFREDVMESGLCDQKHLLLLWGKYKRSKILQELCKSTLEKAEQQLGKLVW